MARMIQTGDPALQMALIIHTAVKDADWGILKDYIEMAHDYLQNNNPLDLSHNQWGIMVTCLRTYYEQVLAAYMRAPTSFPAGFSSYMKKLQLIHNHPKNVVYCDAAALLIMVPSLLQQSGQRALACLQAMDIYQHDLSIMYSMQQAHAC